jgi:preprotein translocase subunit SecA
MDELKETSRAARFAQKDPLVEYKLGAYDQFENLILGINEDVTSYLAKGTIMFADGSSLSEAKEQKVNMGQTNKSQEEIMRRRAAMAAGRENRRPETFKREEKKVGRNEPCPCGSGKKYKQCHGK